ncbi:hypothetical protein [Streptomyces sp. B21-083]|uniref:hypothetical protein n=1 Tax=Streptomyces sp. B21-083 TaxID=3039410 RepID=UPI002FF2C4DD
MPRTTALDPLFTAVNTAAFTDRHLANLAAGSLAAVRVPDFLDRQTCVSALAALDRLPTADYDPARVPTPILRFGPALNDYRVQQDGRLDAERYWRDAEAARAAWHRAGMRPDPITVSLARLGSAWGAAVTAATIGGRAVFGGTLREINAGALVHYLAVVPPLVPRPTASSPLPVWTEVKPDLSSECWSNSPTYRWSFP